MRRQDIRPGIDYAYREGNYGGYKRVRFLTVADNESLYTTDRWRKEVGFIRAKHDKAGRSTNYKPASGWLAVDGSELEKGSLQEVLVYGKPVDEEGNSLAWDDRRYGYFLVTSMSYIHGEYDAIEKAEADAAQIRSDREAERKAENRQAQSIWVNLRDKIRRTLGGNVNLMAKGSFWDQNDWNKDGSNAPDHLSLDKAASLELISVITGLEDKIFDLRNEVSRLEDENLVLSNRVSFLEP